MCFNVIFLPAVTDHRVLSVPGHWVAMINYSNTFTLLEYFLSQRSLSVVHGHTFIKPLNMNLGRIPLPKAVPLFIKDKNNWILVMQRTNISQPGRCWLFSHAAEVEELSLWPWLITSQDQRRKPGLVLQESALQTVQEPDFIQNILKAGVNVVLKCALAAY